MGFAKYAQFYKDNGFFAGSKIKATVTDSTFIGQELILSKGNEVIRSMTIPTSGKVEFFTDESGTLTLSADNGTSTISGTVEISAYATYEVTLNGSASDTTREVYADKENVVFELDDTTDEVTLAYTGDIAPISVVSSDSSTATAIVNGNKITINKASGNRENDCIITATVQKTRNYQEKAININVKKYGTIGDWATASDETIVNMIANADAGQINLNDYWNVGDTRKVTLQAITADEESVMLNQPEQEIELVLMHDSISDEKYNLVNETPSHRTKPSFVVGLKNCLENLSPFDFTSDTIEIQVRHSSSSSIQKYNFTHYDINNYQWLNVNFYNALPTAIRSVLKEVKVCRMKTDMQVPNPLPSSRYLTSNYTYNVRNIENRKVDLPSVYEITGCNLQVSGSYYLLGDAQNILRRQASAQIYILSAVENAYKLEYEGNQFDYYKTISNQVKKRGDNEKTNYYTRTDIDICICQSNTTANPDRSLFNGFGVRNTISTGSKQTMLETFDKSQFASTYLGISPIMFI